MQAVENLFRSGPLAFLALEHARNKKQRLPKITPSESTSLLAQWDGFSPNVLEIENRLSAFNVFAALNATDYETRHSDFLAWLLSPEESHGRGDAFLRAFLTSVFQKGIRAKISNISDWATGATVERERYGRIDLVILNRRKKFVCVIENKLHTGEHTDQLQRYRQAIEKEFSDYEHAYVFLSLRPEKPSDPHYVGFTYSELSHTLKSVTPEFESNHGIEWRVIRTK